MVLSVLFKLLYDQSEHKTEPSESPWNAQQLHYSACPEPCPEISEPDLGKTKEKGRMKTVTLGKLSHMMGRLVLNFGYTLELSGSFKKIQMPRLHPRPTKSGFGGDGTQTSELF